MEKNEGICYKIAYNLLCSLVEDKGFDPREVILVHGSVIPQAGPCKGQRINHAWVMAGNTIHDNSVEPPIACNIDKYELFNPVVNRKYSCEESTWEYLKSKHYGPWQEHD